MSLELAIVSDALTITATIFDHKKGAEEKGWDSEGFCWCLLVLWAI